MALKVNEVKNMTVTKIMPSKISDYIKGISSDRRSMIKYGFTPDSAHFGDTQIRYTSSHENNFTFFMQILANVNYAFHVKPGETKKWVQDALKPNGLFSAFVPKEKKGVFGTKYVYDTQKLAKHFEKNGSFSNLLDIVYQNSPALNGKSQNEVTNKLLNKLHTKAKSVKTVRPEITTFLGALWGILAQNGVALPNKFKFEFGASTSSDSNEVLASPKNSVNTAPNDVDKENVGDILTELEKTPYPDKISQSVGLPQDGSGRLQEAVPGSPPTPHKEVHLRHPLNKLERSYILNNAQTAVTETVTMDDSITSIGSQAFDGFKKLTSITLSPNLKSIGKFAFCNCKKLTQIVIPTGVKRIEEATFYGCSSLESVRFESSIEFVGLSAFFGCKALKNVVGPISEEIRKTIFRQAHPNEPLDRYLSEPRDLNYAVDDDVDFSGSPMVGEADINPTYEPKINRESLVRDFEETEVTHSYANFDKLGVPDINSEKIEIPAGLRIIDQRAYANCPNLKEVTMSNDVLIIGESAFLDCTNLAKVQFSKRLEIIKENAFSNCTALKEITIPKSVIRIKAGAFANCSNLQKITFEKGSQIASIANDAFIGCTKLKKINGLKDWTNSGFKQKILDQAGNEKPSPMVESGYTEVTITGGGVFDNEYQGSKTLKKLTIANGVHISDRAFENCLNLSEIVFFGGDQHKTNIGSDAFCGCKKLTDKSITGNVSKAIKKEILRQAQQKKPKTK